MSEIVNLRIARKQAKRRQAEQEAARRRAERGRPRTERTLTQAKTAKGDKDLDQHHIEKGGGS